MAVLFVAQGWLIFPGASIGQKSSCEIGNEPGVSPIHLSLDQNTNVTVLNWTRYDGPSQCEELAKGPRPRMIFFYGNAMCLGKSKALFSQLANLGVDVISMDYPGFGTSTGSPSETSIEKAAEGMFENIIRPAQKREAHVPLIIAGWSLGGAVAIDLASKRPHTALAVFSTFTSMTNVAWEKYFALPIPGLVRHPFDSASKLSSLKTPVFIAHGTKDSVVPAHMGDDLAAIAGERATKVTLQGYNHDVLSTGLRDPVLREPFCKWLGSVTKRAAP